MELSYKTITFCDIMPNKEKYGYQINFMILLAKYFIFKSKCEGKIPSCAMFVQYLCIRLNLEKTIATMKKKINTFNRRWQQSENLLF